MLGSFLSTQVYSKIISIVNERLLHRPSPDIAGLNAVIERLLALDDSLVPQAEKTKLRKTLQILPPLPEGVKNGKTVLLPYTGPQTMQRRNSENPELYSVYPFRLFGIGKPGLQKAIDTFESRLCRFQGCWSQDPVQSAMLGLTDTAKNYVVACFRSKEPEYKFPAFWRERNDYTPDQDNGGNGELGLQNMIMYNDGAKSYMLPAFPENWSGFFKLHAPGKTQVVGRIKNGKLTELKTTPERRRAAFADAAPSKAKREPLKFDNLKQTNLTAVFEPAGLMAVKQTLAGGPSTPALPSEIGHPAENAFREGGKHMNSGQDADGFNPRGVNTGLVIDAGSPVTVNAIQFVTAEDMPKRDPLLITIEATNEPGAMEPSYSGWKLLYSGTSGLAETMERRTHGMTAGFANVTKYRFYRLLITQVRDGSTDGVQYSRVILGKD